MGQLFESLGVGGVVAAVVMVVSLIGMVKCAKKQYDSPIAKPLAVVFLLVLLACAGVLLTKTGVLGGGGQEGVRRADSELRYGKAGYFMLGKQLAEKMPNAKTLIITKREFTSDDTWDLAFIQAFKDGAAGKLNIAATAAPLLGGRRATSTDFTMPGNKINAKDSNDLIRNYPDCTLIVFAGIIPGDIENLAIWAMPLDKRPKLGLINCNYSNLKTAIQSGAVLAVVGSGPTYKSDLAPKDIKAAFDSRYIMITPENVVKTADTYKTMFDAEAPKKK